MQADYQAFIDRLIQKYEGGYGWDKGDPGGPTKFGITCYDLAEHRGQTMSSMSAWAPLVKAMTLAEAEAIYQTKYATKLAFNQLKPGRDTVILDYGVNSGVARPLLVARRLLNVSGKNGVMDAALIAAINAANGEKFISDMCAERLRFMHAIKGGSSWARFGGGWQKRVDDVRAYSLHLEGGTIALAPPAPDLSKIATPKAKNTPKSATGATAGGVVPATIGAHEAGLPWYGVAAVAAAVIVAGIAFEAYEAHKSAAANNLVHA